MILKIILMIIVSYLLGAIPTAYILTKIFCKKDIRELGSKNVGATNVYRSVGKFPAILTLIVDISKGWIAVMLCKYMLPNFLTMHIIAGFLSIIGHSYTIFLRGKGGKSVATAVGVFLSLAMPAIFITLIIFVSIVGLFGYISVASIISAILLPLIIYYLEYNIYIVIFSIFATIFVVYRHKENIKRLINGKEKKFGDKS